MAQQPMYSAVVNSPPTELSADITASDTTINVVNAATLPSAPNLLTIGVDETAETVRYTKVSGNTLTVERAFQGVAKAWSSGTKVARYYTAYDHDVFVANLLDLLIQLGTKETPEGAQAKANAALAAAKTDASTKSNTAETNAKNASLPRTGGSINGALEIIANAGGLNLVGMDHFYIGFYPKGLAAGRKAYYGFPGATSKDFSIYNEDAEGDVIIRAKGESISVHDLKQSVSSGKTAIAASITGKGISASGSDTFAQLATKIGQIQTGVTATATVTFNSAAIDTNGGSITATVPSLGFTPTIAIIQGVILSNVNGAAGAGTGSGAILNVSTERSSSVPNTFIPADITLSATLSGNTLTLKCNYKIALSSANLTVRFIK